MCAWKERTEMSRLSIATWTEIGVFVPRPPTHTEKWQKQTVMNSLFFLFCFVSSSTNGCSVRWDKDDGFLSHRLCASTTQMWLEWLSERVNSHQRKMPQTLPCLSLFLSLSQALVNLCVCVCVHYQANPSPLSAECFSKVYSTARQAGQRKDSILLPLLTHGKSAALPRALVSVVLLSRATDRGHKMGLEGTQHRALTFLIATVEATVTGMVKKREAVFTTFAVLSASFFHEANSLCTWQTSFHIHFLYFISIFNLIWDTALPSPCNL